MKISRNQVSEKGTGGVSKTDEFLEKFQRRAGHSGRGGHIIKYAKLRIKPKKTQADSPKLRPCCKETRGINRNSVKLAIIHFKVDFI